MTDDSGSERRRRSARYTVRFDRMEDAILRMRAELAGVPVATLIRSAVMNTPVPRGAKRPTTSECHVVQMLSEVGRLTTAFDRAVDLAAGLVDVQAVETAMRDQAEMRLVLLAALGVEP